MGEHKTNRQAVIRAMLPAMPVGQVYSNVQLQAGFTLKAGLLILAPEQMRKTAEGVIEVLVEDAETKEQTWQAPPDGFEVVAEGDSLGYQHLDYVVNVMGSKVSVNITAPSGGHPMQSTLVATVARMPALDFLGRFGDGDKEPSAILTG